MLRGSEAPNVETERTPFIQRSSGDFILRQYTDYELKQWRSRLIKIASKEKGKKRELLMKIANDLAILLEHEN